MKITLTQEDIDAGIKEDCRKCPLARAIEKVYPGKVQMFEQGVYLDNRVYPLPLVAEQFVHAFDRGGPVGPIEFEISEDAFITLDDSGNVLDIPENKCHATYYLSKRASNAK